MFEPWPVAYNRILEEVRAEMPDADDREQFAEYARRCDEWKRTHGIWD